MELNRKSLAATKSFLGFFCFKKERKLTGKTSHAICSSANSQKKNARSQAKLSWQVNLTTISALLLQWYPRPHNMKPCSTCQQLTYPSRYAFMLLVWLQCPPSLHTVADVWGDRVLGVREIKLLGYCSVKPLDFYAILTTATNKWMHCDWRRKNNVQSLPPS